MASAMRALDGSPVKVRLIGVPLSLTTYDEVVDTVVRAATSGRGLLVTGLAVHGFITSIREPRFLQVVEQFDVVAADGHPVRYLLNKALGVSLPSRVAGTDLMERLCARCAQGGIGIYLYGNTERVLKRLVNRLTDRFPGLRVLGSEPSIFRPLTQAEHELLAERINRSGAGLVFLGLGCPLQETMAVRLADQVRAVQVCAGAAFDFLSGNKRRAPRWMRRSGLEWLYRLLSEPRRLASRYLVTNSYFVLYALRELFAGRMQL
jgi:N-acetylglucosaminyldiphosphoundecaprenol N-acetyl-beta-D-mannosaminyltransferase